MRRDRKIAKLEADKKSNRIQPIEKNDDFITVKDRDNANNIKNEDQ